MLDNAWAQVEQQKEITPIQIDSNIDTHSIASSISLHSDTGINSPLDLQGPSEIIRSFDNVEEMELNHQQDRDRYLQVCLQRLGRIEPQNWILNNDRERYGSDEEGAI